MDAVLNPQNENQSASLEMGSEKSELMQLFEMQVNDPEWAYRDLLKAILLEGEGGDA